MIRQDAHPGCRPGCPGPGHRPAWAISHVTGPAGVAHRGGPTLASAARRAPFGVIAALVLAGGAAPAGADRPEAAAGPSRPLSCGPNTLYMFLKLHDRPVPEAAFFRRMSPGRQGLSLADLRDGSRRFGLPAEVRCCTYEDLLGARRLPMVALLQSGPEDQGSTLGHYVLLVDAKPDGVTVLDGTSGEPTRYSRESFRRQWKGYVLVPSGIQAGWLPLVVIPVACVLLYWLMFRFGRPRSDPVGRPRPADRHYGGLAAVLLALAVGQARAAVAGPGGADPPWRCPERDGVNCLYLQLRLLGYKGTYERVVAAVPGGAERASLGGLRQAAGRLGFELTPVELTVAELSALRAPAIVLFEETGLGHGRFHLFVRVSGPEAHLVDGAFILRGEHIPMDRFRRGWTGFALVSKPRTPWLGLELGSMLGAATALGAWGAYRRTQGGGTAATARQGQLPPPGAP